MVQSITLRREPRLGRASKGDGRSVIKFVGSLVGEVPLALACIDELSSFLNNSCGFLIGDAPDEIVVGDHSIGARPAENHAGLTEIARLRGHQVAVMLD